MKAKVFDNLIQDIFHENLEEIVFDFGDVGFTLKKNAKGFTSEVNEHTDKPVTNSSRIMGYVKKCTGMKPRFGRTEFGDDPRRTFLPHELVKVLNDIVDEIQRRANNIEICSSDVHLLPMCLLLKEDNQITLRKNPFA